MAKRPATAVLSLALLALAAAGLLLLGLRVGLGERAAAFESARARLRARASESARELINAAHRLQQAARAGAPGTALWRAGRFVEPMEPVTPGDLKTIRGRDPMGDWLLERAGRAEFDPRTGDDPQSLYRSAASAENEDQVRKLALYRLAAICRREGTLEEAALHSRQFLSLLSEHERRTTRQGLTARALAAPRDEQLEADLLNCLGGAFEPIALGLLNQAGLLDPGHVEDRRLDLRLLERVRPLQPAPDDLGARLLLQGGILRAREPLQDGSHRFAAGAAPALGPGQAYLLPGLPVPEPSGRLAEVIDLGETFPGVRILAAESLADVERSARARSLLIFGALLLLLCGLGLAVFATLRAARREAAAASAQSEFVAQVGHDLRTPLTLIRIYAETLAGGKVKDPAQAREFAGIAAREAERLSRMVGTVLELSRTASNGFRPIDLQELLRDVAAAHRPLFREQGLELDLRLPADPVRVAGDRDALQNALGNLLENELRHAAGGGPVRLSLSERSGQLVLELQDRGPGLPPGLEDRLFDRFVRGPGSASKGAGLGLALVKEVIERHGGTVRAENREGGGARFELRLPLLQPGEDAS